MGGIESEVGLSELTAGADESPAGYFCSGADACSDQAELAGTSL